MKGVNSNANYNRNDIQPDERLGNRGLGSEDLLGLEQLPGPNL
jgi:hypothetical protein